MGELKELRNTKLCYPSQETWFICWSDDRVVITAYGSVLETQCMESKYCQVDYYTSEEDWNEIILNL